MDASLEDVEMIAARSYARRRRIDRVDSEKGMDTPMALALTPSVEYIQWKNAVDEEDRELSEARRRIESRQLTEHLRAWRKHAELTQEDLAIRAGLDISTIKRLERKGARSSLATLGKLAGGLGIQPSDLATRDPYPGERVVPSVKVRVVDDGHGGMAAYAPWLCIQRVDHFLSLGELSRQAHIRESELRAIERQEQPATSPQLRRLAKVLGISPIALIS